MRIIKWFHGLKVAQKLALISFVFIVPDSLMLYLFITSINETIEFGRLEQVGNAYQRPLERLLHLLPQQRLAMRTPKWHGDDASDAARSRDIDKAFAALAEVDSRIGAALSFTSEGLAKRQRQGCDVASVRGEWERLKSDSDSPADVLDQKYLQIIDHVRAMISHAGDMSNLILDPDLDSYYLMDTTLLALPQTQDRLSRVIANGEDLFDSAGELDAAKLRVTLAVDQAFLKTDDLERIASSVNTTLTSGNAEYGLHPTLHARLPGAFATYQESATVFNDLTGRLAAGDKTVSREQFIAAGDAAREAAFSLWNVGVEELDHLLQDRIDHYTHRRARSLAVAAAALLAAVSFVTFITRSISGPLKRQAAQLTATNAELSKAKSMLQNRVVQSDAALQLSEQKYQKIFENAVMGIFQIAPDSRYRSANPALAAIFGYATPEELLANDADANQRLYADPAGRRQFFATLAETGSVTDLQSEILRKGEVRWVSENARAVRDANGRLLYYEGTMEDVTQRRRAEIEEQRSQENAELARAAAESARAAAVAASTAKSDFLASMSHEIRTPLNGVIGMADLLALTALNPQQSRYVKIIQSSSSGLLSIINQILDFSKIEAGKLELSERAYDLPQAVEEVAVILGQKAAAKGIELACQIDPRVPAHVRGDDDRLRQVLMNIVNNAIKFTHKGEVVVRVTPVDPNGTPDDRSAMLRFSVTDTGPGIPADRMHRLFKSFSQVDSSTTRQFGGTGLGLAISKQLVELMGGRIGVESTVGKGSTFWFTLKVGLEEAAVCELPPASIAGRRVLIVDDSTTQCQVVQEQLQAWGVESACVTSALAGLNLLLGRAATSRAFDAAIIDVNMPQMSGLEMGKAIRASSALKDLPLIFMSGIESTAAAEEAALGQFLPKPVRQSSLLDAVMKALVKRTAAMTSEEPSAASEPALEVSAPPAPAVTVDPAALRILLAEDMEVNQFVVTETLRRSSYTCDIANNGREALAAASAKEYDVVLMDCQMPEMSGLEAAAAIREVERSRGPGAHRATIVALTANAIKGDREQCLAAGMDEYMTKPLNPTKLIKCLEEIGTRVAAEGPLPRSPATIEASSPAVTGDRPAPPRPSCFDADALLARCDGDEEFMRTMLRMFQEKAPKMWDDLLAGFRSGDASKLARLAHGLKGTAANLSATEVSRVAARMEEFGRAADLAAAEALLDDLRIELDRCREAFAQFVGPATNRGASYAHRTRVQSTPA